VELEIHQLALRYERLKVVRPEPERRLLASLAEVGQQVPIVVVPEGTETRRDKPAYCRGCKSPTGKEKRFHPGLESCGGSREAAVEA